MSGSSTEAVDREAALEEIDDKVLNLLRALAGKTQDEVRTVITAISPGQKQLLQAYNITTPSGRLTYAGRDFIATL